ncbi:prepilin peptidase [Oceanobacillus damuensis]|uniref:prepilin peptidase n=1 Tax=Oceanobacillus damuensis TaxID=937928 RepID=UPI0008336486|nr:A24 family peptidase [Oceanobacillus damuensis]
MTSILFLFYLLGLILGSFYNVVGLRLPKNISFANDRSVCPHCKHQLAWYENVPLLSFLIQRGKCRHCQGRISYIYPVIEFLTAALFAFSFYSIGFETELITALLFVSMLMIVLVSDITYMLIPNKLLLFFLPLFIVLRIIEPIEPWWSAIGGAIIGFGLIFIIILISRGGMGAGDMKLFGVLGIVLGMEKVLLAFFLSCLIGSVIGMMLILFKIIDRKQPVPFGPYIVLSALITYFYGNTLINWYFNLLI